eukprot:scaffold52807_cov39-Prasinocladus_malaysianus.AAC.2
MLHFDHHRRAAREGVGGRNPAPQGGAMDLHNQRWGSAGQPRQTNVNQICLSPQGHQMRPSR